MWLHLVPLVGAETGWHCAHTATLPTFVDWCLPPPPFQPLLACGALQLWQLEVALRQVVLADPPFKPDPWQDSQYRKPDVDPGADLAAAPC